MEQSFHNMSLFFVKLHVWVIYVPNLAFTFHHIFLNDRYVILQTKRYSNWFWGFMSQNILCSQKKLKSSQYTTCPHFIPFSWRAQHFGIAFFSSSSSPQFFRDFGTCPDINSLEKSRIHQKPRGKITVVITTCPKIVSCCWKTLFISNLLLSLVTALL